MSFLKNSQKLFDGIISGDIRSISKAITIVESNNPSKREGAEDLISKLLESSSKDVPIIGISGPPGTGKSTFIEQLGYNLAESGKKVAVLAVDPSSSLTKGSILGDKTRMDLLSNHPNAYIRPSPTGNVMGGVTNSTRESIAILQSGGFDIIFIETVGVGQSEYLVRSMCDIFLLLYQPGSGDDLQGIKKGIIEIADFIAVTKDDGENQKMVRDSISYIKNALSISKGRNVTVCSISAYTGKGIDELWDRLMSYFDMINTNGHLKHLRYDQREKWIKDIALNYITNDFNRYLKGKKELHTSEKSIFAIARNLNAEFMESGNENFIGNSQQR